MRVAAGFTLIEVLVAVLVLAVGLIGGTAMQLHAMRARQESALLSAALQAATSMAERIRANGSQAEAYLRVDYDAAREPSPAPPPSSCLAGDCDRAALAALDIHELKRMVRGALPAGRARVCRDARMWHAGRLRWACSGTAGAPIVVKVGWRGKNPDGTPQADDPGGFVPGIALAVAGVRP